MSVFLQPIYTQTVGSGGAASVTFNNIPQTFTDLKVVCSVRASRTAQTWDSIAVQFNNETTGTNYSATLTYALTGGPGSIRETTSNRLGLVQYASSIAATANTFGNGEIYIPNYLSANFKQIIGDSVAETNGTADYLLSLSAGLWRNTSAITSITTYPISGGTFLQYSTFTLYGITRG